MSADEPDFKEFARSWVRNDPRLGELSGEQSDSLIVKMAQALDRRRQLEEKSRQSEEGRLTLSLASDCLQSPRAVHQTLSQVAEVIEQQAPHFR